MASQKRKREEKHTKTTAATKRCLMEFPVNPCLSEFKSQLPDVRYIIQDHMIIEQRSFFEHSAFPSDPWPATVQMFNSPSNVQKMKNLNEALTTRTAKMYRISNQMVFLIGATPEEDAKKAALEELSQQLNQKIRAVANKIKTAPWDEVEQSLKEMHNVHGDNAWDAFHAHMEKSKRQWLIEFLFMGLFTEPVQNK